MSIDSATLAWQKAHHPLEFYKVVLQRYTNKGEKNKVTRIKKEMQKCGIVLNNIKFGQDNRNFSIDKTTNAINQTMASIKDIQKTTPQELYNIQQNHYDNFIEVLKAIDNTSINSKTLTILIYLNYFSEFGNPNQLLKIVDVYNRFGSVKVLTKSKLTPQELKLATKYARKATEKQLREIDTDGLINELIGAIKDVTSDIQQVSYDLTYLGYTNIISDSPYYGVEDLETTNYGTTYISLYNIKTGQSESYKLSYKWDLTCEQGDILEVSFEDKPKKRKDENGNWINTGEIEKRIKLFSIKFKNPKTKS
jgi:DNA polymerase-3 subunit alpha